MADIPYSADNMEQMRWFQESMDDYQNTFIPLDSNMRRDRGQGGQDQILHPVEASVATGSGAYNESMSTTSSFIGGHSSHPQASSYTSLPSMVDSRDEHKSHLSGPSGELIRTGRTATRSARAETNSGAHYQDDAVTAKRQDSSVSHMKGTVYALQDHEQQRGTKRPWSGDASDDQRRRQGNAKRPLVQYPGDNRCQASTSTTTQAQGSSTSAQGLVIQAERQALGAGLQGAAARWSSSLDFLPEGFLDTLVARADAFAGQMYDLYREQMTISTPALQRTVEVQARRPVAGASDQDIQDERDAAEVAAFCVQAYRSGCSTRKLNNGEKAYSCKACGAGVNNYQQYQRHSESRFPLRFYRCNHCDKIESRHIFEHCHHVHGENGRTASRKLHYNPFWSGECDYCKAGFSGQRLETIPRLLKHMWDAHIEPDNLQESPTSDTKNLPDNDHGHHEGGGNGDAEGSFEEGIEEFLSRQADYTGHGPSNSGAGNTSYGSQLSGGYLMCSTDTETSEGNVSERGRTEMRRTSVIRSPRINVPSRGDSFDDDENFQLDLVIIRASAYSNGDGSMKHPPYITPKKVSFDRPPTIRAARSSTMMSDASSIGPVTRVGTMWSETAGTAAGDGDSDTDCSSDSDCEDPGTAVLEALSPETPRASTDMPKTWDLAEPRESYTETRKQLEWEDQSELLASVKRLRIHEAAG